MTTKLNETTTVSPSNTKKEILEAYDKLKKQLEDGARQALQPEKEKQKIKNEEVVAAAELLAATKVFDSIDALKSSLNETLADIAIKMEHEVSRYSKVKAATAVKEAELKEIFGIEQCAYSLAALLETQKQKRTVFDEEISLEKAVWEEEKNEYSAKQQERSEHDKKLRQREQEEYEYKLKREREQKTNALQDEINGLEKELAQKKEAFEQKVTAKEAELKERETLVVQEEKRLVVLEVQVDKFPGELEKAIKKTETETSNRLTNEMARNEELLRKTYEGEKNVLNTRIEALEQLVAEQRKRVEQLSAQLEKAYGKVQDIAVTAVSSTRERYASELQAKGHSHNEAQG
ncbi:MAG: hypothetical protein KKB30_11825 [Proteobacteria bacterium]|nr:hypothetical protein [Pseudomonadota bacterium]MBU1714402.1 hypothetical protein [Pseudomonadota bacterium]